MQKRIDYLDNLKGFAMICIVLGHCSLKQNIPLLDDLINSFHVPIFFLISGVCFSFREKDTREIINSGMKHYILPYLIFETISLFIDVFLSYVGNGMTAVIPMFRERRYKLLFFMGGSPCWFLPCIFLVQLVFQFEKK